MVDVDLLSVKVIGSSMEMPQVIIQRWNTMMKIKSLVKHLLNTDMDLNNLKVGDMTNCLCWWFDYQTNQRIECSRSLTDTMMTIMLIGHQNLVRSS